MPLTNINYQNTIMYRIVCRDLSIRDCYVGHTTLFTLRKYQHKQNCNTLTHKNYNIRIYKFIREHGGWDNWIMMIEIEKYPCGDSMQARIRERYWMEFYDAQLNVKTPFRTKEELRETEKEYYQNNKEVLIQKTKEYYRNNKEALLQKSKEYRENNNEYLLLKKKEYRENNRDKIAKKNKETIVCECGCTVTKINLLRHRKSVNHIKLIEQQNATPKY